ncbi:hypothetical protein KCU81_g8746, partial [Aureobasidium melanogenum]|uniref:DUF7587 domain-containing protein n=1 Tax=Aureobasidium melanogenum (strain CBS 110374) TaxID=1043003 RepID=A0A074W8H0_AURM1
MSLLDRIKGHSKEPASDEPESKILREDKVLESKLRECTKKVPRYLFRMWHPQSGGNRQLNTTEKITPLAFLNGAGHNSVYDMSIQGFIDMTTSHLSGNHIATEFSSWSASPRFVLHYATSERESAYIAIIDTLGLQEENGNSMFWVPDLAIFEKSAPGRSPDYEMYDWEYLVHGIVDGRHYKAVPFKSLCQAGLTNYLPTLRNHVQAWGANRFALPVSTVPFSREELEDLGRVASLFGLHSNLRAAVAVTLFCCKKRAESGKGLEEEELEEIVHHIGGRNLGVPPSPTMSMISATKTISR